MTVGIIGAGISGLTAGRILAKAGHEVVIFEKSNGYGGRMSTRYFKDDHSIKLDHGAPYITAKSEEFKQFLSELSEKGLVEEWTNSISYHNGEELLAEHPSLDSQQYYSAPRGMNSIGQYLSRWVDVKLNNRVSGITLIGEKPQKRKQWMLNLQSFNVFEMDALIVAVPGTQAYGLLQTTQDETAVRRLIREIDEASYKPSFSVMLGYHGVDKPDWKAFNADNEIISLVVNESSKRDTADEVNIVVHTNASYAQKHVKTDKKEIAKEVAAEFAKLTGKWASKPAWANVHFWRYNKPTKTFPVDYMELDEHPAMLALVGDYFQSGNIESAYLSGYKLGNDWVKKLQKRK